MNRRKAVETIAALGGATFGAANAGAQAPPSVAYSGRLRPGLVAYTYRNELQSKKLSYEDVIRMTADMGLEGLDTTVYWFPDTSAQYLASLRRTAYKNGVSLYSVAVRVRLCQPTADLQEAEVANAKKWVDVAERLGATHVRVFGGAIPKGATEEQAIAWAAEVLKRAVEYSGSKGIILGVEDDGGLTTNAGPTIEIVKRADSPWAGMNLDCGNFPKDGYAQIAMAIPYAVSTHIKAQVSTPEGKKEKADFSRIFGLLARGGYRGFVSLEYEETDAMTAVPGIAAELKRAAAAYRG
ncbi:MAG TPA: sugar phosphate isomerase/epimerase family protein [Bryobacteraceae bacterium]|nr:sugar phosphate isomerase/epimerase family protein [Bryobacteraceae bacterium]